MCENMPNKTEPVQKYFQVVEYTAEPVFYIIVHGTEEEVDKELANIGERVYYNTLFDIKTFLSLRTILRKIKDVFEDRQIETFLPYKNALIRAGCSEEQMLCAEIENTKLSDLLPILHSIEHDLSHETEDLSRETEDLSRETEELLRGAEELMLEKKMNILNI